MKLADRNEADNDIDNMAQMPKFKVGVLFVHGIGEQCEGETLRSFTDPIVSWIREWLFFGESNRTANTKLNKDKLLIINESNFSRENGVPPHIDFTIHSPTRTDDDRIKEKHVVEKWRFVECHWADVFPTPSTFDVVKWTIPVLPAALVSHFARRHMISKGKWLSKIGSNLMAFTCILPALVFTTLAMLALLLLSLIPIDKLKAFITLLQQKLELIVGDSYVFIQSPSRRAAILSRFHHDLEWLLGDECDCVVVVAHSQGAAVAFHGLRTRLPQKLKLFVTIGAGINKIWELSNFREQGIAPASYNMLLMTVFLGLAFFVSNLIQPHPTFLWLGAGLFLIVSFFSYGLSHEWGKNLTKKQQELTDDLGWPEHRTWYDFFASSDPVANGPLPDWFRSTRSNYISNHGSLISDHTTYNQNIHQFIAPLVEAIGKHTCSTIPLHNNTKIENDLLKKADQRHNAFVTCLTRVRLSIIVSLGLNLWLAPDWFEPIRKPLFTLVKSLPFGIGNWLGVERLSSVIVLVIIAFSLYWLFFQLWSHIVKADLKMLQQRSTKNTEFRKRGLYLATWFVAVLLILSPFASQLLESLTPEQKAVILSVIVILVPFVILLFLSNPKEEF